jgi:hypothetical protein
MFSPWIIRGTAVDVLGSHLQVGSAHGQSCEIGCAMPSRFQLTSEMQFAITFVVQ